MSLISVSPFAVSKADDAFKFYQYLENQDSSDSTPDSGSCRLKKCRKLLRRNRGNNIGGNKPRQPFVPG
jgi:hypothetical protein